MDYDYFSMLSSRGDTVSGIFPAAVPPAMAYIPWQTWKKTYDAETALKSGTLFPELNFPLAGEEALK